MTYEQGYAEGYAEGLQYAMTLMDGRYSVKEMANLCKERRGVFENQARIARSLLREREKSSEAMIAAAPDLLQALEQILGWQKLRRGLGEIPIERIEQIAEAAIGKAKGTTVGP